MDAVWGRSPETVPHHKSSVTGLMSEVQDRSGGCIMREESEDRGLESEEEIGRIFYKSAAHNDAI